MVRFTSNTPFLFVHTSSMAVFGDLLFNSGHASVITDHFPACAQFYSNDVVYMIFSTVPPASLSYRRNCLFGIKTVAGLLSASFIVVRRKENKSVIVPRHLNTKVLYVNRPLLWSQLSSYNKQPLKVECSLTLLSIEGSYFFASSIMEVVSGLHPSLSWEPVYYTGK